MKRSWKLGRFAGIDTFVHWTFFLLVGWAAWANYSGAGTALAAILGVTFLLAVFGSVLLHELGHALVARHYGIRTRKIVLSPIGGIAQLEGMPKQPRQELAVALAGPAVNFALAAGLYLVTSALGGAPMFGLLDGLMWANLSLGLFNLVPAFPMDGGRALRAFLATRVGSLRATEIAAGIGKAVAIGMGVIGLATNWVLVAIAVFVWFAANTEVRMAREQRAWEAYERDDRWFANETQARSWPWTRGAFFAEPTPSYASGSYPSHSRPPFPSGYRIIVIERPRR